MISCAIRRGIENYSHKNVIVKCIKKSKGINFPDKNLNVPVFEWFIPLWKRSNINYIVLDQLYVKKVGNLLKIIKKKKESNNIILSLFRILIRKI